MIHPDDRFCLSTPEGPVTIVPSFRATPEERDRALRAFAAVAVVSDLCGRGNRDRLCDLHSLTVRALRTSSLYRRTPSEQLAKAVLDAVRAGDILVVDGWCFSDGWTRRRMTVGPERPRGSQASAEDRIADEVMGGRADLSFEGAAYVLLPAAAWAGFRERHAFRVVGPREGTPTLERMAASPAAGPRARALLEAAPQLVDASRANLGTGLLLVRRLQARDFAPARADGPALTPSQLHAARSHDLLFEYLSSTGHPAADDEGFEFVGPSGDVEAGALSNGQLQRQGVEPGAYELRVRAIKSARWSTDTAHPFEDVEVLVSTKGFSDGTSVDIAIRPAWGAPDDAPLATLSASVRSGVAATQWRYEQKVGTQERERFRFEAAIGKHKRALSDALDVVPHEPHTARGAQERLRSLGYDPGPPADDVSDALRTALRSYQQDNPPLAPTGELDDETVRTLDDQTT